MSVKRERFIKVAEARTNKILDMLRLLGNCADKNNYDYNESEVKQIFGAIEKELKSTKSKFDITPKDDTFKLK